MDIQFKSGGDGDDVFVYTSFEESPIDIDGFHYVILDFEIGSDLIDLTALSAVELWVSDHPLDSNISSILNIDGDGDGVADLQIDMNGVSYSSLSDNINTVVDYNAAAIGNTVVSALTVSGDWTLYKAAAGYVVDVSGLSAGDSLTDDAVSLNKGSKDYPLKSAPDGIIVADDGSIQLIA